MRKTKRTSGLVQLARLALCSCLIALQAGCIGQHEQQSLTAKRKLLRTARTSMVPVRVYFKRDIPNETDSPEEASVQDRFARQMIERKMSLDLGGVVLDDRGHVLVADPEMDPAIIDHIEVIGPDNRIRTARRLTIVRKMDGAILEVDDPTGLEPVSFTRSEQLDELLEKDHRASDSKPLPGLHLVTIHRTGHEWRVAVSGLSPSYLHDSKDAYPADFAGSTDAGESSQFGRSDTVGTTPGLIADKDGNILGVTMRGRVDLHQQSRMWRGQDLLDAVTEDLDFQRFMESHKSLQSQYADIYHQVKIYYRQPGEGEYGVVSEPERIVYGLALDETHILVPAEMSRREAKQIESIEVTLTDQGDTADPNASDSTGPADDSDDPRTSSAELVGVFRDFSAFLIEAEEADLNPRLDLDDFGQVREVEPFYTIRARRRFGQKDLKVWYARCLQEGKGYGDEFYLRPSSQVVSGSLLLDLDQRPAGFYLRQRLPAEEQHAMEGSGSDYLYGLGRSGFADSVQGIKRIFHLSEIAPVLKNPSGAIDPNIRTMTKAQARRRMWLGVEYVPVNSEVVKRVGLERLTKDGTVGFMVTSVYEGSPAEAVGIQPGDVLLRIRDLTREYPTELRTALGGAGRDGYGYGSFGGSPSGGAQIWKSRQNFLTEFLAAIGRDKPIEVTFCSRRPPDGWVEITDTVDVQMASLDYDSAERFRDRKIGLTVRDLTYEVRKALRMAPEDPGVVVSKIEEGLPAAVARISEGELLTRIDSRDIKSLDDFKNMIQAARDNGADTVKVEILRLGKTRVADLSLSD